MAKRSNYLLYPIISGLLFSLPWMGLGMLPLLIAFVPLLLLQERLRGQTGSKRKPRRIWPYAALAFAIWWAISTWWVSVVFWLGGPLSVLIGTFLCTSAFMIYHAVWKRGPRPLAYTLFVVAWISYEMLYLRGEISFPWLTLGNGFAWSVKFAQWFEYTGVFGGSLWVLIVNLLIYEALKRWRNWKAWIVPGTVVLVPILLSVVMYYTYRESEQKVTATVIQPNFDAFNEKFALTQEAQMDVIIDLIQQAPANVDFIVAPETAIHDERMWEESLSRYKEISQIQTVLREHYPGANAIMGANTFQSYGTDRHASSTARVQHYNDGSVMWYDVYNTALNIGSDSEIELHHKSILVVGAEKMPYYTVLKHFEFLIVDLGGITGQLGHDTIRKVFISDRGVRNSAAICYESIYGDYYREFAANGAQVMFIITNDGWWGNTAGHRHHFAYARLRAIETRRSIARSANTGISGFVNQRGDVMGETLPWEVRGALTHELVLNDRITFYTRYGDIIGRVSWLMLGLGLLYFFAWRVRRKSHLVSDKK